MSEVLRAQQLLRDDWQIDAAVFSATSYSELQRDGMAAERSTRLGGEPKPCVVQQCLDGCPGPVIAASDYVRAWPELIRPYVSQRFVTLGTDGFGRSDTRAGLRRFFEVDAESIVLAALWALAEDGRLDTALPAAARQRYGLGGDETAPWRQ